MTDAEQATTVRVSVIVPIYEPGDGFDDLIASLDRQTLPRDAFEVLLCNDGSGPETSARLDEVARTRPWVRVLHLPRTGWPGTPRNHGIDAARGTYVFFSDQDDYLFDDALEKICDFADRHRSDVVIGKVVGIGRRIPHAIFRRDLPHAVLGRDPLLELLTPHKMFRTAFLRAHGIRFPDGKVRLEDHLFVMKAYVAADTISVLASTPIYAWVVNEGSASSSRIDPVTYFPHLEAVLDVVEQNTEPGVDRAKLLRHWYRGKIVRRLNGRRVVRWPDEYRERFLDTVEPIMQRRFDGEVERGLVFPERVRSMLLRAGRREDFLRFAAFEGGLRVRAEVTAARWTRRGRLSLTIRAEMTDASGAPLAFEKASTDADADGGRATRWHPPADLADLLPEDARDVSRDVRRDRVDVFLRDAKTRTDRRVRGRSGARIGAATVTIDPIAVFARRGGAGRRRLSVEVRRAGWVLETPLRAAPGVIEGVGRAPLLAGRDYRLETGADGVVELMHDGGAGLRDAAARAFRRPEAFARRVALRWAPERFVTRS